MNGFAWTIDDSLGTGDFQELFDSLNADLAFQTDATVGRWVAMWNTYDLAQVDSLFLPDARLTCFSSEKEGLIRIRPR